VGGEARRAVTGRAARLIAFSAIAVLVPFGAPGLGRAAGAQTLDVTFSASASVAVTLPDGTPVGTTSGAPTVINAGYYGVEMLGPGGCVQQPDFHLKGPGEELINDMSGGEVTSEFYNAYFAPNSTYTWRLDNSSNTAVYTFVTNGTVGGTPPSSSPATGTASGSATPTSQDIVGSDIAPFRGTLTGAISSAGKLTLSFKGKSVKNLSAGRYTLAVTDKSGSTSFALQKKGQRAAVTVTGGAFVGKRSLTVDLTAGSWTFMGKAGAAAFTIPVS
jgi:hypothetical protein